MGLTALEKWMVKSNMQTISDEAMGPEQVVATLQANGYPRIADAVREEVQTKHRLDIARYDRSRLPRHVLAVCGKNGGPVTPSEAQRLKQLGYDVCDSPELGDWMQGGQLVE